MAKRLTIKTLLDVGHRQREVAELTSVLERSVRRVAELGGLVADPRQQPDPRADGDGEQRDERER